MDSDTIRAEGMTWLAAMVYVFCVQTAKAHAEYDQLDLGKWEFYVAPHSTLSAAGHDSVTLSVLERSQRQKVGWSELVAAVGDAALGQEREDDNIVWWQEVGPRATSEIKRWIQHHTVPGEPQTALTSVFG